MSTKNIPRLMIVTGDDPLAIGSAPNEYLAMIEAERGRCAVELFDPLNEKLDAFLARAMTASLFQELRLYRISGAQSLTDGDLELLGKTLDYEIPDVYIFVSAETDKKSAAGAKLEKHLQLKKRVSDKSVTIKNVTKPYDNKLADWIIERAAEKFNRKIGKTDAQLLADSVEYGLIDAELRKIDTVLAPGAPIDGKAIRELAGVTRAMSVYELAGALGKRDFVTSLLALDSLLSGDFYAPLVASTVFRHFWHMLKIKRFLEDNPGVLSQYNRGGYGKDSPRSQAAFEIGKACGILGEKDSPAAAFPKIIIPGIVDRSQKFSTAGLVKILNMLQRFDADIKTGKTEPIAGNLQMLCYKIVRTR